MDRAMTKRLGEGLRKEFKVSNDGLPAELRELLDALKRQSERPQDRPERDRTPDDRR